MDKIIKWLLEGDVSIQYQTKRDLLDIDSAALQKKIINEGWGKQYLDAQNSDGSWGRGFYQPKWTSSHYTLLDLKNLNLPSSEARIHKSIKAILQNERGPDGGVNPSDTIKESDVCINGMFLNYASYFKIEENDLKPILDFIIGQKMNDGGFNCRLNRSGARHSSFHTTICVLEGFYEYRKNGYQYRSAEIKELEASAVEFILKHELYISDHTHQIIDDKFLRFTYPFRWRYTLLRALDFFRYSNLSYDGRMEKAIDILGKKKVKDGWWKLQSKFPGAEHFAMEKVGEASRWLTLMALRILKHFNK